MSLFVTETLIFCFGIEFSCTTGNCCGMTSQPLGIIDESCPHPKESTWFHFHQARVESSMRLLVQDICDLEGNVTVEEQFVLVIVDSGT